MPCFSLRACFTRSHLYQRRTFCKSLSKPLPILSMNLQDSLFSIICKTHSNDSFFLVVLLFWKESTTNNSIFCSILPLVYFIYEGQCRRSVVFKRVIRKRFIAIVDTKPGGCSSLGTAGSLWSGTGQRWKQIQSPQFFLLAF